MDFTRNELIWGKERQKKLQTKHVTVFGLGGVGGYALDSLARAGVGHFRIIDFDTVATSNINRQLIALNSTVGEKKTELFKKRLLDINPKIEVECIDDFYNKNLDSELFAGQTDYVIDAIDTMRAKIDLLIRCHEAKIPTITSMGAGNRKDPTQLYICDIKDIENKKCTFTQNMLYQLAKKGITEGITAACSRENPKSLEKITTIENVTAKSGENFEFTKITPGSTPFVPAVAGYYLGWYVLEHIL